MDFSTTEVSQTIVPNKSFSQKPKQNKNSVDPGETAHHEPSHQDLHCLPMKCIYLQS